MLDHYIIRPHSPIIWSTETWVGMFRGVDLIQLCPPGHLVQHHHRSCCAPQIFHNQETPLLELAVRACTQYWAKETLNNGCCWYTIHPLPRGHTNLEQILSCKTYTLSRNECLLGSSSGRAEIWGDSNLDLSCVEFLITWGASVSTGGHLPPSSPVGLHLSRMCTLGYYSRRFYNPRVYEHMVISFKWTTPDWIKCSTPTQIGDLTCVADMT